MPEQTEYQSTLLSYLVDFLVQDWFASVPITACFIVMNAVIIDRLIYYSRNERNLSSFVRGIQGQLEKKNLDGALSLSQEIGGLLGQMTEEGIRLIKFHAGNFSNSFDISASLYVRDLEKRLSMLSTIGATCPFLGLFGTVVGVIVTLRILGEQGGQSALVVQGVAKALIATGYGLIVAIVAVIMNNYFNGVVERFESDFRVIKLTLLDYLESQQKSTLKAPSKQQASPNTMNPPNLPTQAPLQQQQHHHHQQAAFHYQQHQQQQENTSPLPQYPPRDDKYNYQEPQF